ncbi:hypothetical protein HYFRA_00010547, partial [Hymenoscyphus fraxineus]
LNLRIEARWLEDVTCTASDWLSLCHKEHPLCSRPASTRLPTRLIDVGPPDGSQEPRLVVPNSPKLTSDAWTYIALSYCWGDPKKNITTTPLNIEDRKNGIPWEAVPKTIRHAILLTRSLKIRYIWIDALCIIQGPGGDWDSESSRMADVYGGAFLTISAALSYHVDAGLLRPDQILSRNSGIRVWQDYTMVTTLDFATIPPLPLSQNPLYRRAWALQERMLSPREFSCRELSFETDKLPALSGIAEHWPRSIEHKYLAGLWEDNLMFDLTWKHEVALYGNKIPLSVPTNYRAPTWSWASVDGNIKYNCVLEQFQPWSTLISSNIVLKNPASPFGEVLSGSITLRGRVLSGRADLKNMEVVLSDGIRCGAWIDQRIRKERVSLSHDMVSNNIKAMAINEGSTSKEEKGTLVNCLVLGVWNGNKPLWYAMILRRVKAREGVFERIGILVWVGSLPGIKGVKDTNVTIWI